MDIVGFDQEGLLAYTVRQLGHVVPDGVDVTQDLRGHLPAALQRTQRCINGVKVWPRDRFDPLHSSQYCAFLYYWGNTIWRETGRTAAPLRLFLLNKALNAIDCFYEIQLPEVFFIGHSVGIVLAKATYGNHLVLYQNATVGKNHGQAPVIEDGVVLYPNSAVIGDALVRSHSIISQGVSVIGQETRAHHLVFQGEQGRLLFKPNPRDIWADFFRA